MLHLVIEILHVQGERYLIIEAVFQSLLKAYCSGNEVLSCIV